MAQQTSDLRWPLDRRVVVQALLAFALLNALLFGTVGQFGPTLDDSYIHLQFARSLAQGDGLAYREGLAVSGSTGPLWTALLSIGSSGAILPGIDSVTAMAAWSWILSGLLLALAALELARLAWSYGLDGSLITIGVLWFLLSDLVLWSTASGMEILLFVWLSTLGMRLHQQRRLKGDWQAAATALTLSCLARPEGALLLLLAAAERLWLTRRVHGSPARALGALLHDTVPPLLLLIGPFLAFGLWSQGSALPTTYAVKTDALHRGYPALRDLWLTAGVFFRSLPVATTLAIAGILELLRHMLREDSGRDGSPAEAASDSLLPALWLLGLPCAYSSLTAPGSQVPLGNFGRYVYPLIPAMLLLALLALAPLWRDLQRRAAPGSRRARLVAVALAALLVAPGLSGTRAGLARTTRNIWDIESGDAAMARWLRQNVPPDTVLGVQDIGAIGYLTDLPLFDLAGLIDPEVTPILKSQAPGALRLRGLLQLAEQRGVDLLVVFPESYGGIATLQAAAPGLWQELHSIDIDDNQTLAGSRLSVLRPPWNEQRLANPPDDQK